MRRKSNTLVIGELITRIQSQKKELVKLLSMLQESALQLKAVCQRSDASDTSAKYMLFANIYLRLSGAALQALRRTSSADRSVSQAIELDTAETLPNKKAPQQRSNEFSDFESDLNELYGEAVNG